MAAKTEAVLADASERFFDGCMRHTAHGYWLEEAGARRGRARAGRRHRRADVVVIGGGYTGLWTAWQLRARGASVVLLEADLCGHGPSGRNGGFCETLWTHLPSLVERFGASARSTVCRASAESVEAIGAWCEEQGVDAWFTPRRLHDGLDGARPRRRRSTSILAVAPRGRVARARRRPACAPAATRRASGAASSCPTTPPCSPRGWRSGLRDGCCEAGATVYEHSRVRALHVDAAGVTAETARRPRAGRRRRAGAQRRHARLPAAARARLGHLVAHRAHRAGAGRARGARLDGRRVRSPTRARSCTTSAPRPTAGSRSAGAAADSRPARGCTAASRSTPTSPRTTHEHLVRDVPGARRAGRSPTPGAARSTSRPATCRRSARSTARPSTTRSASPATASARPPRRPDPGRAGAGRARPARAGRPDAGVGAAGAAGLGGGMLVRRAFLRKERLEERAARSIRSPARWLRRRARWASTWGAETGPQERHLLGRERGPSGRWSDPVGLGASRRDRSCPLTHPPFDVEVCTSSTGYRH